MQALPLNPRQFQRLAAGSPIFASCITNPPLLKDYGIERPLPPLIKRCLCGCGQRISENKALAFQCRERLTAEAAASHAAEQEAARERLAARDEQLAEAASRRSLDTED